MYHGREKIAQRLPHTVQLVEQMQNDGDTLIIDTDIALEVVDQMHSREVDFGKLIVAVCSSGKSQPSATHASSTLASRCARTGNS